MANLGQIILISLVILVIFAGLFWLLITLTKKQTPTLKEKPKSLIEAEKLFNEGYYNLAIIRGFVAMEKSFRQTLNSQEPTFQLIDQAYSKSKISTTAKDNAHSMRILRNKLVHESDVKVTPQDSEKYLRQVKQILAELGFAT